MESTGSFPVTDRTRVRRLPDRAAHDTATVHAILDAGLVCQLGFVEGGRPIVIPTAYARVGDTIFLHGSSKSRTMMALAGGAEVCLTVTLLDGLVLARSAFHHSVNYRSVVVFGRARAIEDEPGKLAALEAFTDRLIPGRWRTVRPPNPLELRATLVLALPLTEAVGKVRAMGPIDDAEDMTIPVWAGVVPLTVAQGTPVQQPPVLPGVRLQADRTVFGPLEAGLK